MPSAIAFVASVVEIETSRISAVSSGSSAESASRMQIERSWWVVSVLVVASTSRVW